MRDIILSVEIETNILDKKEQIDICIDVIKDLHNEDKTINDYIIEYMKTYMQDSYCSCSFNESQNHCDCGCGDWGYEYEIININSEDGGIIII